MVLVYEHVLKKQTRLRAGQPQWNRDLKSLKEALLKQRQCCVEEGLITSDGELAANCNTKGTVSLPRYARVNTLLVHDLAAFLRQLQQLGWHMCTDDVQGMSRKRYLRLISSPERRTLVLDRDIANLLVFPVGADLHDLPPVLDGRLLLQDKASCLPVCCLDTPSGCSVIDACAAPGMKSAHVATYVGFSGRVFSFDKSRERTTLMRQVLTKAGVTQATVANTDFLTLDVNTEPYNQVEYVLVDPPCSGSGIVSRNDDSLTSTLDERRLNSLGNLQAMLLKHAMRLPSAQRIVYSTCSVMERENEMVVHEVLHDATLPFQLAYAMPGWKHRGRRKYSFAKKCLRASPNKDRTNGFFVAVFERRLQ